MGNGGTDISAGIDFGTSLKSYQIAILIDYTMKGGKSSMLMEATKTTIAVAIFLMPG
jgi:hypothetical protein